MNVQGISVGPFELATSQKKTLCVMIWSLVVANLIGLLEITSYAGLRLCFVGRGKKKDYALLRMHISVLKN